MKGAAKILRKRRALQHCPHLRGDPRILVALLTFLVKHMLFKWQKLVLLLIPAVEYLGLTVQNNVCSEFANFCDTVPGAAKKLKTPENQTHEEMAKFKGTAPMPITKGANPLDWWKEHECKYPLLSNLAKRYLCIPGTSVSSESFLYGGGHYHRTEECTHPRAP